MGDLRTWWKKKRWIAALLLLLVSSPLLYIASEGPAIYIAYRTGGKFPGWFWEPLDAVVKGTRAEMPLVHYQLWWINLARRHAASK